MRITQLTLFDFIRLKVSKIREISMDTDHGNTQLIIGSNGSGKSSILRELLPYPSIKTSFGKSGFKSLSLHHNNDDYKITYDAAGTGHGFFVNNSNLNVSGTNEIQKELIYEHFGLNTEINLLLRCGLPIHSLLPAQRKQILMKLNPVDINVFLEKYKKVHKDVVSYNNNLDRLYARQKQLLAQRLPEEQYREMLKLKERLESQEKTLLVWITQVSSELAKFQVTKQSMTSVDELTNTMRSLFGRLPRFSAVKRENCLQEITRYKTMSEVISAELTIIEDNIRTNVDSLNTFESQKSILAEDGITTNEELSVILAQVNSYSFTEGFNPASPDQLEKIIPLVKQVAEILLELSYISYDRIYTKAEVQHLYKLNADAQALISTKRSTILTLTNQRDGLIKDRRVYDLDNCQSTDCELRKAYDRSTSSRQADIDEVAKKITTAKLELDRITEIYETNLEIYNHQDKIWTSLTRIFELVSSHDKLRQNFSEATILERIQESPGLLSSDMDLYIQKSQEFAEFSKLSERVRKLEEINASQSSRKQVSIELLDRDINWLVKQLDQLRESHRLKVDDRQRYDQAHLLLSDFTKLRDDVVVTAEKAKEFSELMVISSSNTYLTKLYNIIRNLLDEIRSELIDITRISKEQEMLIVRLDSEIESIIAELKPKFENAKEIEKSLQSLPIEYTKSFINNIIETTNYFINEIMTYSMQLLPYKDDEVCDFAFRVVIDDVMIKDISLCSEGQCAVIQLAFNLAAIIELNFTDYPVLFDEIDRSLDYIHKQRLTEMIIGLVEKGIFGQIFVVGHHASMLDRFATSGNITVLNPDNVILPDVYNQHTKISYS